MSIVPGVSSIDVRLWGGKSSSVCRILSRLQRRTYATMNSAQHTTHNMWIECTDRAMQRNQGCVSGGCDRPQMGGVRPSELSNTSKAASGCVMRWGLSVSPSRTARRCVDMPASSCHASAQPSDHGEDVADGVNALRCATCGCTAQHSTAQHSTAQYSSNNNNSSRSRWYR